MGKKSKFILVILYTLIIVVITMYFNLRTYTVVKYNFDVINDDFIVRDFTLVTFKDKYYIPKDYKIEKRNSSKGKVSDISMEIYQDGKLIKSSMFGFEHNQEYEPGMDELGDSRIFPQKIELDKVLDIRFKYTLDGVEKESNQTVELDKHIEQKL
ncbi:hypothetical protein [Clostridium sp. 'White wine YQ']|uniref:hypothetical protein n=1 Tax=Clostridium sp. 'White wine YQ' TaxID=3027474 RepID=UPI0023659A77|nr:hypothetical protein [Clostridium sp. 'White wine YQ']MDD7795084.1 hypothetical protein [Clostridium sp. 'White wine YQ']